MASNAVEQKLTLGDLIGAMGIVVVRSPIAVGSIVAVNAAMYVATDTLLPIDQQGTAQGVLALIGVGLSYTLLQMLLRARSSEALAPAGRFSAYFGLSIVLSVGILLGFVALIVPGLFLAARWTLAAPLLLAEDKSIGDAMSESWQATARHWGVLIAVFALLTLPLLGAIVGFVLLGSEGEEVRIGLAESLGVNIAQALWSAGLTVLSVAAYERLYLRDRELAGVFA